MPEHVVGSGETLGSIAGRYKTSVAALAQANGIANVNLIRVGQRLRLPVGVRSTGNAAAASARIPAPAAPTRGTPGREGSANRFIQVIEQHVAQPRTRATWINSSIDNSFDEGPMCRTASLFMKIHEMRRRRVTYLLKQ